MTAWPRARGSHTMTAGTGMVTMGAAPPYGLRSLNRVATHTHTQDFPRQACSCRGTRARPRTGTPPSRALLLDMVGAGRGFHWPHVGAARTHLDQACGRVPPLLKVFLPVLLLDFQGEAGPQNALQVTRVRQGHGPHASLACALRSLLVPPPLLGPQLPGDPAAGTLGLA